MYIHQVYYTVRIGILQFLTHLLYIYTWYIRTAVYVAPWYYTTKGVIFITWYLFRMCATDVHVVAGMINRAYVS